MLCPTTAPMPRPCATRWPRSAPAPGNSATTAAARSTAATPPASKCLASRACHAWTRHQRRGIACHQPVAHRTIQTGPQHRVGRPDRRIGQRPRPSALVLALIASTSASMSWASAGPAVSRRTAPAPGACGTDWRRAPASTPCGRKLPGGGPPVRKPVADRALGVLNRGHWWPGPRGGVFPFREECPRDDCRCPDVGSAFVARPVFGSVLTWPAAWRIGCRSLSSPMSFAPMSQRTRCTCLICDTCEFRSWRGTAGRPEGSKFPMRAALNPSLPTAIGPPQTTRRPAVVTGRPREGKSGVLERTCLPHTNTGGRLI